MYVYCLLNWNFHPLSAIAHWSGPRKPDSWEWRKHSPACCPGSGTSQEEVWPVVYELRLRPKDPNKIHCGSGNPQSVWWVHIPSGPERGESVLMKQRRVWGTRLAWMGPVVQLYGQCHYAGPFWFRAHSYHPSMVPKHGWMIVCRRKCSLMLTNPKLLQNCAKISCDGTFLVNHHSSRRLTISDSKTESLGGLASGIWIAGGSLPRTGDGWMKGSLCLNVCTRSFIYTTLCSQYAMWKIKYYIRNGVGFCQRSLYISLSLSFSVSLSLYVAITFKMAKILVIKHTMPMKKSLL